LENNKMIVFPNPSNGTIKIAGLENNFSVTIVDMKGTKVAKFLKIKEKEQMNINHLNNGLYLILIQNDNQSIITKKLLIN
jgi:hypothetical protein